MPGAKRQRPPSYRLHTASGQAVVTLGGRDHYLGPHGTPESRTKYDRVIAEWLANGRSSARGVGDLTVAELVLMYYRHAEDYYRKDGKPTSELQRIRVALRPLKRLYGSGAAAEFGPLAFKAVRQAMVDATLARVTVNRDTRHIKRMFKWATGNELVPPSVYHGLQAVGGLKRGRCQAREVDPVAPAPSAYVDAALNHMSRPIRAMVELQLATGMRPGEVVIMRTIDIDTTGKLWVYTPFTHKTEHHEKRREIYLGARAQELLRPFLRPDLDAFLFSPAESEHARSVQRRRERKSPMTPSQARRRPKRNRRRAPRERYGVDSYRRAIWRACDAADAKARGGGPPFVCQWCGRSYDGLGHLKRHAQQRHGETVTYELEGERVIPRWSPNQLRHNFATRMRKEFGLEVTRVLLGHSSVATSEIYAERDSQLAASIVEKIG